MNCLEASRVLDAYVDDELDAAGVVAMRDHLASCPACGTRLSERLALQRLLRAVPSHGAPERLRRGIVTSLHRRRRSRAVAWAAAAALALSVGGATAARVVSARRATTDLASALVADHVESLRAQHLVDVVSSDQHTVKPWFLGKIDFAPPVQDLAAAGFPLAGGRVDHVGGRAIAVLVYHRRLHPITLFIWPDADARESATANRTVRGFHAEHWVAGGMSYWAVSDVNADDLTAFVGLIDGHAR